MSNELTIYPEWLRRALGLRAQDMPTALETGAGILPVVDVTQPGNLLATPIMLSQVFGAGAWNGGCYTSGDQDGTTPSAAVAALVKADLYWAAVWVDIREISGAAGLTGIVLYRGTGYPQAYQFHEIKNFGAVAANGRAGHTALTGTIEPIVLLPGQSLLWSGVGGAGASAQIEATVMRSPGTNPAKGW